MASVMPASPTPPTATDGDGAGASAAAAAAIPDAAGAPSLSPARLSSPSLSWAEQAKVRHSATFTNVNATAAAPPSLSRAPSQQASSSNASITAASNTHESPPPARTNSTIKARGSTGLTSSTTSPLLLSHTPQRVHVDPLAPPSPLQLRTPVARPVATPLSHLSSNSSFQGHGHHDASNMSSPSHSRSHSLQQQQQQLLLSQQRAEAHLSLPLTASSVPKSYPIQLLGGPSYASGAESPSSASLSQLGHHPSPASSSYGAQSFRHGPLSIHESVRCSSTTSSCAGGGGGGSLSARRGSTASMTEAFLSSLGRHAGAPLALQQHQQLEHGSGLAAVPHQPEQVHAELKALMAEQVALMTEVSEELAEFEAKNQSPSSSLSPPPDAGSPAHSSVHSLLMRQQSLIARSLQSLSQSLSSFLLMRDIYLSAAYAERRVRAQLALDLTLSLHRKKGLEASTDAIIACLVSSLGAENCAIYYVGSTHLFGLEPSDPRSFDPYRARRFRKNEFVAGFVAAESKPVLLARRANEHAFFDSVPDSLTGTITRSLMCVPIRDEHDGTVLAVIQMINKMRTKSPPPPPPPPPSQQATAQPASASGSGSSNGEQPSLPPSGHSSAAVTTSTSVASSSCVSTPSSTTTEHHMSSLSVPPPVQPLNPRRATSGSIPSPKRSAAPTNLLTRTSSTPMIGSNAAAAAAGYAPIPMLLPSPSSHVPVPAAAPASSASPPSSNPRGSSGVFTFPSTAAASTAAPSDSAPAAGSTTNPSSVPRHSPSISATPSLSTASDLALADPSSQQLFDDEADAGDPTAAGGAAQAEEEPYPYGEFSTEDLDLLYSLSLSLAAPLRRFLPEILLDSFSLSGRAGALGDGQMYGSVAGEQLVGALGSSNNNHVHLLQHAQMLPLLSQSPPLDSASAAASSQEDLSSRSEASSQGSARSPDLSPRKLGSGVGAAIPGEKTGAATSTSIYNSTATPPSSSPSASSATSQPVSVPAGRGSGGKSSRSSGPVQRSDSPPAPVPASVPTPIPSRLAFAPSTFSSGNIGSGNNQNAARAGGPVSSGSSTLSGTTYALPTFGSGLGRNTAPQPITTSAVVVAPTPAPAPPAVAGQFDADQVRSLVHSYAAGETKQPNRSNRGVTRARTLSYQWPANDKGAGSPFAAHLAANGGVLASTAAAAANSSAVAAPAVSSAIPSSNSGALAISSNASAGHATNSRDTHSHNSHHNSPAILGSSTPTQSYLPLPSSASASPFISATMGSFPTPHPHLHPNPFPRVFSIEDLHSLSFCVFDYSETELVRFIVGIFTSMGLIDEFKIPLNVLHGFLMGVRKGYRANPFHNFIHGFSVMHFAYYTLRHSTASEHLLPHDVLGLLVASLTHDLDHPGQTNAYEIASQSALALRYNDIHVLECLEEGTLILTCDPQRPSVCVEELCDADVFAGLCLQGASTPVSLLSVRHNVVSHIKFEITDNEGRTYAVSPNHRVTLVWGRTPHFAHFEAGAGFGQYPCWQAEVWVKTATPYHAVGERVIINQRYWPHDTTLPEVAHVHNEVTSRAEAPECQYRFTWSSDLLTATRAVHRGDQQSARNALEAIADELSLWKGDVLDMDAEQLWARMETEFRADQEKIQPDCVYAAVRVDTTADFGGVRMVPIRSVVRHVRAAAEEVAEQHALKAEDEAQQAAEYDARLAAAIESRRQEWRKSHANRPEVSDDGLKPFRFVNVEVGGDHRFVLANGTVTHNSHHACSTFTLLRQEKCNIFREITAPEIRSSIRGSMVKAILSTDMSLHFTELKKLDEACTKMGQDARAQAAAAAAQQQQYSGGSMPTPELVRNTSWPHSSSAPAAGAGEHDPSDPSNLPVAAQAAALRSMLPFDPESEKDRQSLINVIIHSADLSGQVFPTHIARQWEERISREFAAQAALETAAGLPVAPFMRGLDSLQTRAKLQVNFIEFVLLPWWRSAARLLSPALDPCLRILQQNKEYFERLAAIGQPIGPGGEDAIMLAAASAPPPQPQQQPAPAPIQPPPAPIVAATPPRVSAVSVSSPRLQSNTSSPMIGTSKALRVLGITAIPPQVVTGTPNPSATRDMAGSPMSSPMGSGAAPLPFSPTTASSPILMRVSSLQSHAALPPASPAATAASAAPDPSTKSQLHAVQAVSPKTTPVQTASSVLKSVPLLSSHNPARSSGGLAYIQPSSSLAHSLDSPGSGGRKRSSTEVTRPARRSGGPLSGSGGPTHSLGGGTGGGHGMLVEEGGDLRFAPSGTRIDPHVRHAASGALLQELGLPRVHKDSIAEDEPPTLDGGAASSAGTSASSTASSTAPSTPARA